MSVLFPNTLPAPLASSIAVQPYANNIQVTSMTAGEPKRRKLFTYVPKTFTCTLRLTANQANTLQDFYSNTANATSNFTWRAWFSANTSANQDYAFLVEPSFAYAGQNADNIYWDATLTLLTVKS